ncbi:MAG: ABC transporter permease [Betaproteobacteria bacterium]|nr:ABC transporter permease [Betaproteobacteria bacterium]
MTAENTDAGALAEGAPPGAWAEHWRRFSRDRAAVAGLAIILIAALLAIFAGQIAQYDPSAISRDRLLEPSYAHLMGTDNVGKDVFSGVLYGARVSLTVGILAGLTSLAIGLVVGALSGYYGGWLDSLLMRMAEFFQIIPRFFLAIVIVALLGGGLEKTILVIGVLSWPATARIIRAQFLALREREMVEAARAAGFSNWHIIVREILPNAIAPAIVQGALDVSEAILLESSLSFFGLSNPDMPSWGEMLNRAQPFLRSAWWMSLFPGLAIFTVVLCFNLIADGLNDMLNPDLKER